MDRAEISRRIEEILRDQKTLPADPIDPDTPLETFGFDSLDALNIVFALEETFKISISDDEVRDVRSLGRMVEIVEGHLQS
ncbi:MAG: acyl carrier protein [Thermoanaerobaculia bacterium]|nr:acyl carrier protein [Thermoanaerobaculia bacterium]